LSSVRERWLENNDGPNRGVNTDHSQESWGNVKTTNTIHSTTGIAYQVTCQVCGSQMRVTQKQINEGYIPKCLSSSCGVTGDTTRRAGIAEQRVRQDVISSPRQRAEMAARAVEQAAFENEGGQ
jgi:hypothetical protein